MVQILFSILKYTVGFLSLYSENILWLFFFLYKLFKSWHTLSYGFKVI